MRTWPLALVLASLCGYVRPAGAADTAATNQIGQGVIYRHYHYDSLYGARENIFITEVNLNDPATAMKFPYRSGGATRTVSAHAATVPGAVACVNGQFFDNTGPIAFLKVNGVVLAETQPSARDQQGVTDDGLGQTSSFGIALRPTAGWDGVSTSNVMTAGPELVNNGLKVTGYNQNDGLITNRHPRTCTAWTYDNRLLLVVVDGRSTASAGMTIPELRDYVYGLGPIRNAFNLDGGGSSAMWIAGDVVNVPSDGQERAVVDAVAIAASPPTLPGAPGGLTATRSGTNIYLSWPLASGAMSYNVKRSSTNGSGYLQIANTTALNYLDTNVSVETTWYYVVTGLNMVGESTNSPQATGMVTVPPAKSYPASVLALNPLVYYRFSDVRIGSSAFNAGNLGLFWNGTYEGAFGSGAGPRPPVFVNFETTNQALVLDGSTADVRVPALGVRVTSATLAGWVYKGTNQAANAAIFFHRSSLNNFGLAAYPDPTTGGDALRYTWNGTYYTFVSGLVLPTNQWAFVALVVEPTRASLYLQDGTGMKTATKIASHPGQTFSAASYIGWDSYAAARRWNGLIDEAVLFDRAFSPSEINTLYQAGMLLPPVFLQIRQSPGQYILEWPNGTLQQADSVNGQYSDMTGVTSPYTNTFSGTQKFFRVKVR